MRASQPVGLAVDDCYPPLGAAADFAAAADGLPAGEAAQLTITRSDRVRWASAVQYATAWAASSTGLL